MLKKILLTFCLLLIPVSGQAAILHLDAPASVYTGTAFLIRITLDSPEAVTLQWQKASITLPPRAAEQTDAATADTPRFVVEALLPVSLDATVGNATLACSQHNAPGRTQAIEIKANTFETQRLTVASKYVHPPQAVLDQIERDRISNRAALDRKSPEQLWSLPFYRPVPGTISSSFGLRRVFNDEPRAPHRGLDMRGAEGTPIHACADGVVVIAEEQYYSGNCVFIDHGAGVVTTYLHMSAIQVAVGQRVARGEVIGLVGATGRVTGPHLHLGLSILGTMVDPLPLLESVPAR